MNKNLEIDNIDLNILSELVENAKLPYTEVADRVFVSGGTVHVRMKKLEKMGIVKGAGLYLDYSKLGYDLTAFLGIYLEKSSLYDEVSAELEKIPEILSMHFTTGRHNIFAKVICRDTGHFRDVLNKRIQKIKGIERTEAFVSLEERIKRAPDLKLLQDSDTTTA